MESEALARAVTDSRQNTRELAGCRLVYLVGQLRLGGLERQLYYLVANLDHAMYQPAVVVWNLDLNAKYYRDIERLKIPICGYPVEWSPWDKLRAFRALVQQVAPEIIHSYSFHTNFAAYYAARGTRALAIGSLRGDLINARKDGGFIRGVLNSRWPRCHISNSATSADAARQSFGLFGPRHLYVVRNGLDLKRFVSSSDSFGKRTYVAAVGSLFPVKRWDRLLKIVKQVKDSGIRNVCFRIAGTGPLRNTLEELAQDLGVSQEIQFWGEVNDIPAFLEDAKFLVHTSESEGCPNAVMEAMACSLPVVAMEAGDIPYLVEEGKTGFVVNQGNQTAFVERVIRLLTDDQLCSSMSLAARVKAEREFKLGRLVSETLAVYKAAGWTD